MINALDHPRFQPTSVELIPPLPSDVIGDSILRALSRRPAGWLYFEPWKVAVTGAFSLGLYPIFALPKRFRGHVALEQHQLQTLIEWLKPDLDAEEADVLTTAAKNIQGSRVLKALMQLSAVAAIATLIYAMVTLPIRPMPWRFAWGYSALRATSVIDYDAKRLAFAYAGFVSMAYLFLMWQVNVHSAAVEKWLLAFDVVGKRHGLTETPTPGIQFGLTPVALVFGVALAASGAYWALPMMLASNAARRYIKRFGRRYRATLAHRVRTLMLEARPGDTVPLPIGLQRLCKQTNCLAVSPADAKFCSRCGKVLQE